MIFFAVKHRDHLRGEIFLSGDKSIAHRAVILSSISRSKTKIENFPANEDCLATVSAFKKLGIKIKFLDKNTINVSGKGLFGLRIPEGPIFIKESGTTFRLLLGVLAGQNFTARLTAGKSLSRRPMLRVTQPLRLMGAKLNAKRSTLNAKEEYPPIKIQGGNLNSIIYKIPIASAQVKSAILLAALFAKGKTHLLEPVKTRDHTERMFKSFKADIKVSGNKITVKGERELVSPKNIYVPGDISSAAFFIVAATIVPNSKVLIRNVSLNPTRTGILEVLKRMGADIKIKNSRAKTQNSELMGDLLIKSSSLKAVKVKKEEIPFLIDEIPILMIAASLAKGRSVFEGAQELRVKETDRIRSMSQNLRKMGVAIKVVKNGSSENIVVQGVSKLKAAKVKSFGDHRTAMSMIVAGLAAGGKTQIDDISCIDKSFPGFVRTLYKLS